MELNETKAIVGVPSMGLTPYINILSTHIP